MTRPLTLILLIVLVVLQPACGEDKNALPHGYSSHTLFHDGNERSFLIYRPKQDTSPLPVVLAFHGGFGSGHRLAQHIAMNTVADRHSFLVVYPNALGKHWSGGRQTTQGTDDVEFVRRLIGWLREHISIDTRRVYATGPSNGGYFSHRLACEAANLVAASAPVNASLPVPLHRHCQPKRSVPMMLIAGKDDPLMPWSGGELERGRRLGGRGGEVLSVPKTAAFWAKNNHCSRREKNLLPDYAPNDGTRIEETRYSDCSGSAEVLLWGVEGGGHTWPGSRERRLIRHIVGATSQDISASKAIWDFFSKHRLGPQHNER